MTARGGTGRRPKPRRVTHIHSRPLDHLQYSSILAAQPSEIARTATIEIRPCDSPRNEEKGWGKCKLSQKQCNGRTIHDHARPPILSLYRLSLPPHQLTPRLCPRAGPRGATFLASDSHSHRHYHAHHTTISVPFLFSKPSLRPPHTHIDTPISTSQHLNRQRNRARHGNM